MLRLTWDCVRDGLISVKGGRDKTGAKQRVGISPALADVLDELRAEYRKVPNTGKLVFTKEGKRIPKATLRHAFDKAVADAKIEDFQFRDFRHCARTRWAAAGLPYEIAETAIGHKLKGIAGRYVNLTDDQITGSLLGDVCNDGGKTAGKGGRTVRVNFVPVVFPQRKRVSFPFKRLCKIPQ